jgi:hypothetical protein
VAEKDPVLASKVRTRSLHLLLVIAVAVILVLSYTSITYYQQAKERDEKYRGQYVLAQMMELSLVNMIGSIDMMMNDSYNLTQRFQSAQIATSNFGELSMECEVMKNMYSSTSEEYLTFGELEHASSRTSVACNQMLMKMWENITNDEPYVHNMTRATAISDARGLFYTIMYCIGQGFDPSRDWQGDPYSVVNSMDLDGIRANAELIVDTVPIDPY